MFYGGDANDVSLIMKTHAVVADAQPELRRFNVLETLYVAFAVFQVASQRVQDAQSSRLIDSAELRPGLIGPDNVFVHAQRFALPMRSKSSRESPKSASTFS